MTDLTNVDKFYLQGLIEADIESLRDALETCDPSDVEHYQLEIKQSRTILSKVLT